MERALSPAAFAAPMAGRNRMSAAELLQSEVRRRILGEVRARPGSGAGEVARRLGISHPSADRHLSLLSRRGLLLVARDGPRRRYHLPGARGPTAGHPRPRPPATSSAPPPRASREAA